MFAGDVVEVSEARNSRIYGDARRYSRGRTSNPFLSGDSTPSTERTNQPILSGCKVYKRTDTDTAPLSIGVLSLLQKESHGLSVGTGSSVGANLSVRIAR